MVQLPITILLSSLLAIWFYVLNMRIIRHRKSNKISIGDGDNSELSHKVRAQANFAEHVPILLILTALAEMQGVSYYLLVPIALAVLFGRLAHGYVFSFLMKNHPMRVYGMMATFIPMLALAIINVIYLFL